jgi:large subunit ribosomal protein L35
MGKGLKTKHSVRKRFKVTGTGKLMVRKISGRSHLLAHKSPKRKRQLKRQPILGPTATRKMKDLMHI